MEANGQECVVPCWENLTWISQEAENDVHLSPTYPCCESALLVHCGDAVVDSCNWELSRQQMGLGTQWKNVDQPYPVSPFNTTHYVDSWDELDWGSDLDDTGADIFEDNTTMLDILPSLFSEPNAVIAENVKQKEYPFETDLQRSENIDSSIIYSIFKIVSPTSTVASSLQQKQDENPSETKLTRSKTWDDNHESSAQDSFENKVTMSEVLSSLFQEAIINEEKVCPVRATEAKEQRPEPWEFVKRRRKGKKQAVFCKFLSSIPVNLREPEASQLENEHIRNFHVFVLLCINLPNSVVTTTSHRRPIVTSIGIWTQMCLEAAYPHQNVENNDEDRSSKFGCGHKVDFSRKMHRMRHQIASAINDWSAITKGISCQDWWREIWKNLSFFNYHSTFIVCLASVTLRHSLIFGSKEIKSESICQIVFTWI